MNPEPTIPVTVTQYFGQLAEENRRMRGGVLREFCYVRRYKAKGEYIHIISPDQDVVILTLPQAERLAQDVLAELRGDAPSSRDVPDLMAALEASLAKAREETKKPRCQICDYPEDMLHHQGQGKGAHPFIPKGDGLRGEAP